MQAAFQDGAAVYPVTSVFALKLRTPWGFFFLILSLILSLIVSLIVSALRPRNKNLMTAVERGLGGKAGEGPGTTLRMQTRDLVTNSEVGLSKVIYYYGAPHQGGLFYW